MTQNVAKYASRFSQWWRTLRLDGPLLAGLGLLSLFGLVTIYSASRGGLSSMLRQVAHVSAGFIALAVVARVPPERYRFWTPWIFCMSLTLLSAVLLTGIIGKGAQRWLHVWIFQFQPSELMKLLAPMILAWYLHEQTLPPRWPQIWVALGLVALPAVLVARQPDLGTALLITAAGISVLLLAGLRSRVILGGFALTALLAPLTWQLLRPYQQARILGFLNPERDPLGRGYHLIQSKIAIGSGGLTGKGWLQGTQSQLQFLPENTTDFIFAVWSEEWGLIGSLLLLALYLGMTARVLKIARAAQDSFSRLLVGAFALSFFVATFVNIGMVSGILPVVGVPLPLFSYGGTSFMTWMTGFGLVMSIKSYRKLLST